MKVVANCLQHSEFGWLKLYPDPGEIHGAAGIDWLQTVNYFKRGVNSVTLELQCAAVTPNAYPVYTEHGLH